MKQKMVVNNDADDKGNPTGGSVVSQGLLISWQDGPLGRGKNRKDPNGAFVETVIEAAKQRLEYYQASKFKCDENMVAIAALQTALDVLESRTQRREASKTEGTHRGS